VAGKILRSSIVNTPIVLIDGGLAGIGRATAHAFALLSMKHELRVMFG
jgi:NAD(P)-dependent dehydrogenase (short-subunit alcohol dehydrogenase family)